MGNKFYLFIISIIISLRCNAAHIDTLAIYSNIMKRNINTIVIQPDKVNKKYPVVFLLHGHSGNEYSWLHIKPNLPEMAEKDDIIIVCPNGENSWYFDSSIDNNSKFETFISKELISYIDKNYPTLENKDSRAIIGFSMGGHGALWLAIRHNNLYSIAGSTSGGVDFRPFPENWNIKDMLGSYSEYPELWNNSTIIGNIYKLKNKKLKLIIDCGVDDFFIM